MDKYNSNMLTTKFVQNYIKNRLWEKTSLTTFLFKCKECINYIGWNRMSFSLS